MQGLAPLPVAAAAPVRPTWASFPSNHSSIPPPSPLPPLLLPPLFPAELVELRNLVTVGELVMSSALQRRESRGGHYCSDYPEAVPQECVATVINTPVKRRLDLGKISIGGAVLFGASGGPSSPKRGAGARSGDLLTTRSNVEE